MSQKNKGRVFLQREVDQNRRRELVLAGTALIALGRAGGHVLNRQVYFI